jgi:hypothetical protein
MHLFSLALCPCAQSKAVSQVNQKLADYWPQLAYYLCQLSHFGTGSSITELFIVRIAPSIACEN